MMEKDLPHGHGLSQRDAFWKTLYECAHHDKDIVVLSSDMGAPALDQFRKDYPHRYVAMGVAEQNAILVGSGLSLAGKKVFVYAINAFVALNCLEKIKIQSGLMKIPLTIVGVGAGLGYSDSGPTHHSLEDFAAVRAFPNIDIYNVSDSPMAACLARDLSYSSSCTHYLRLDRQILPDLGLRPQEDYERGFSLFGPQSERMIVATGVMVHEALSLQSQLSSQGLQITVMDLFRFPIRLKPFLNKFKECKKAVTLEEHFLSGGLGGAVAEVIVDHDLPVKLKRIGLSHPDGYCYQYGGRKVLQGFYKMGAIQIKEEVTTFFQSGKFLEK